MLGKEVVLLEKFQMYACMLRERERERVIGRLRKFRILQSNILMTLVITIITSWKLLCSGLSSIKRLKAKNLFYMYNILLPPGFNRLNYQLILLFDSHSSQYQSFLWAFLIFTYAQKSHSILQFVPSQAIIGKKLGRLHIQ